MREELSGRRGNSERLTVKASTHWSPKTAVLPAVVKRLQRKKQGKTSTPGSKFKESEGHIQVLTFLLEIKQFYVQELQLLLACSSVIRFRHILY